MAQFPTNQKQLCLGNTFYEQSKHLDMADSLGLSFVITTLAYRQLVPFDQIIKDRPLYDQIKFWKGWTGIWQTQRTSNNTAALDGVIQGMEF